MTLKAHFLKLDMECSVWNAGGPLCLKPQNPEPKECNILHIIGFMVGTARGQAKIIASLLTSCCFILSQNDEFMYHGTDGAEC